MSASDDERRVTREGIHIDREVADAVAIEEELDSNLVGPYLFPDPRRRRVPAAIYAVVTVVVAFVIGPLPALLPATLALWHTLAAWPLTIDPEGALGAAATAVPFSIGHASAAVTFHGLRARPRWSVIVYSASEPPDKRALVVVDALRGQTIGDAYVEDIAPVGDGPAPRTGV